MGWLWVVPGLAFVLMIQVWICQDLQKRVRKLERDVAVLNRERTSMEDVAPTSRGYTITSNPPNDAWTLG